MSEPGRPVPHPRRHGLLPAQRLLPLCCVLLLVLQQQPTPATAAYDVQVTWRLVSQTPPSESTYLVPLSAAPATTPAATNPPPAATAGGDASAAAAAAVAAASAAVPYPVPRTGTSFAFLNSTTDNGDPARASLFLFGGVCTTCMGTGAASKGFLADLWRFDGLNWKKMKPVSAGNKGVANRPAEAASYAGTFITEGPSSLCQICGNSDVSSGEIFELARTLASQNPVTRYGAAMWSVESGGSDSKVREKDGRRRSKEEGVVETGARTFYLARALSLSLSLSRSLALSLSRSLALCASLFVSRSLCLALCVSLAP